MNLTLFIPEITMVVTAAIVILLDLFIERKRWLAQVSISGLVVAGGVTIVMWGGSYPAIFNNMLAVDGFALFFKMLFLGVAFLVILASTDYVSKFSRFQGEYYALVLLATLGMMLMAATTNLIAIYIALELASISLYVLVGFLTWSFVNDLHLNYGLAVLIALIIAALLGLAIYRFVLIRLRGMPTSEIIASFAVGLIILEGLRLQGIGGFKGFINRANIAPP